MRYSPVFNRLSILTAAGLLVLLAVTYNGCSFINRAEVDSGSTSDNRTGRNSGSFEESGQTVVQSDARGVSSSGIGSSRDLNTVREPWKDGESVVRAFAAAYPEKIEEVAFRNGDWALRIDETWYNYAGGRMLPDRLLDEAESYAPYSFYQYESSLPALRDYSHEEVAAMEARVKAEEGSSIGRYMGLYNDIWGINDYRSSEDHAKTIYFFGKQVNIHRDLLEDLAGIEARLKERAKSDPELQKYLNNIASVTGHNWRRIDGTSSLSLHSYGIAIDILPRNYSRAQVYWRWARQLGLPWYNLPYNQRFMPPESFVDEFERAGFVWGGKWRMFDTIHFEYRPEIFELNKAVWQAHRADSAD